MSRSSAVKKSETTELKLAGSTAGKVRYLPATKAKEMSKDLQRLSDLQDAHDEYSKIEKRVKECMKQDYGAGEYQAGDFRISVEEKPRTAYEVPVEVKEKYKVEAISTYVEWRRV